jgi:hypothetical protein
LRQVPITLLEQARAAESNRPISPDAVQAVR